VLARSCIVARIRGSLLMLVGAKASQGPAISRSGTPCAWRLAVAGASLALSAWSSRVRWPAPSDHTLTTYYT